ncbi:MAG: hypothetical protein ACH34Y_02630 [Brachymonas sp.]
MPQPPRPAIIPRPWTGLDWSAAPAAFNWVAQDADGHWFWYSVQPICGMDGGVWRSNSRQQQYAGSSDPNPDWWQTLQARL